MSKNAWAPRGPASPCFRPRASGLLCAVLFLLGLSPTAARTAEPPRSVDTPVAGGGNEKKEAAFPFRAGDRVAFFGSSSTHIGVWPQTMKFLLRTRHPQLKLVFRTSNEEMWGWSRRGVTFGTAVRHVDEWVAEFKPSVVFLCFGANDCKGGVSGLGRFREEMSTCVRKVQAAGARVWLVTPQPSDPRVSGHTLAVNRKLYAAAMLAYAGAEGWPAVDIHGPLEALLRQAQEGDEEFTISVDKYHLDVPSYVAWGFFLYELLNPPAAESAAVLSAEGEVLGTVGCKVSEVRRDAAGLSFVREDEILPILPPARLPPRQFVPLEKFSRYVLKVRSLAVGQYEVRCEGEPLGQADAAALAAGVNLNSLLLESGNAAPWQKLAERIWGLTSTEINGGVDERQLDEIGNTRWRFQVRPVGAGR